MKKILIFLFLFLSINLFSENSIGRLDTINFLNNNQISNSVKIYTDFVPFTLASNINTFPFFTEIFFQIPVFSVNFFLDIPILNITYEFSKHLKHNFVFTFGATVSSPFTPRITINGINTTAYVSFKKKLKYFNYKFSTGIEYLPCPGLNYIIKNSFLLGNKNFTFIFSIQNNIGVVFFLDILGFIYSANQTPYYFSVIPEMEFNFYDDKFTTVGFFFNAYITFGILDFFFDTGLRSFTIYAETGFGLKFSKRTTL